MKSAARRTYGTLQFTRATAQDLAAARGAVESPASLPERVARLLPFALLRPLPLRALRSERRPLAA